MPAPNEGLVREIVERRLAQRFTAQEEAAYCVRVLQDRGFTVLQIAERCGVDRAAVGHWKLGRAAPKDLRRWSYLATFARAALNMPRREETYSGMGLVVFSIMQALDIPAYGVAERVGNRWPRQSGPRWLRGAVPPGRYSTIRLRKLARELGLRQELLTICDRRLREIREREVRNCALLVDLRRSNPRARVVAGEGIDSSPSAPSEVMPMMNSPSIPAPIRAQDR